MCPYAFIIGEKYTYFIAHRYKFIDNDKVWESTLLISPDPIVHHFEKCGVDSFKKLENSLIHTCWFGHAEDEENEDDVSDVEDVVEQDDEMIEKQYLNGNNEVVKIFIQKCVICYERDSVYAFRQCGHRCICEQCCKNKGDIDIIKCVVCRT